MKPIPEMMKAPQVLADRGLSNNAVAQFSFPAPDSVKAAVLADLLEGQRITHKDCWLRHGSSRLSHHIFVLRGEGWPIVTDEVTVGTSDGRQAAIAEYGLPADAIKTAGESGQRFIAEVRAARARRAT